MYFFFFNFIVVSFDSLSFGITISLTAFFEVLFFRGLVAKRENNSSLSIKFVRFYKILKELITLMIIILMKEVSSFSSFQSISATINLKFSKMKETWRIICVKIPLRRDKFFEEKNNWINTKMKEFLYFLFQRRRKLSPIEE